MKFGKAYGIIATLGPIGYLTASGTVATLVTIPFVFWLRYLIKQQLLYALITISLTAIGIYCITKALRYFHRHDDPAEIVFDEFIGCIITFWGVPICVESIISGFILFRIFDIVKFGGVEYVERFNGAWGIMLDDVIAGIMANIILRVIFYFYVVNSCV